MTWQDISILPLESFLEDNPFKCDIWARRYNNRDRSWEFKRFTDVITFIPRPNQPQIGSNQRKWYASTSLNDIEINSFSEWEILFWMPVPQPPSGPHRQERL